MPTSGQFTTAVPAPLLKAKLVSVTNAGLLVSPSPATSEALSWMPSGVDSLPKFFVTAAGEQLLRASAVTLKDAPAATNFPPVASAAAGLFVPAISVTPVMAKLAGRTMKVLLPVTLGDTLVSDTFKVNFPTSAYFKRILVVLLASNKTSIAVVPALVCAIAVELVHTFVLAVKPCVPLLGSV